MLALHDQQQLGDPDLDSKAGGIRFTNIARSSSPFLANRSTIPASSPSNQPLRILCVDDNLINLKVLTMLIKRHFGSLLVCPPVAVDSGLKAIQSLRMEVFDVVFVDIQMPFLSGVECARRIRAGSDGILAGNMSASICAVTTCVSPDAVATYQNVGMDGLIPKPVRAEQLKEFLTPLSDENTDNGKAYGSSQLAKTATDSSVPPSPRAFFAKPVSEAATLASPLSTNESFDDGLQAETRASLRSPKSISIARALPPLQRYSSLPIRSGRSNDSFKMALYDESILKDQIEKEVHSVLLYDLEHRTRTSSSSLTGAGQASQRRVTMPAAIKTNDLDHQSSDSTQSFVERSSSRPHLHLSSPSPRSRHTHKPSLPSSELSQSLTSDTATTVDSFSRLSISIPHDQRRSSSGTLSSNGSSDGSAPPFDDQNLDDTDSCADTPLSSPPALIVRDKFWSMGPSRLASDK